MKPRIFTTFLLLPLLCSAACGEVLTLDNGAVRVGCDLKSGGAITWFSESGTDTNLVNNYDRGRQIQQSYYAGEPLDRREEGQHPSWSPWPWNPIQVGDAWGNSAEILESRQERNLIYTKCRPLLWDMRDEAAEAMLEQWTTLDGNRVHVRNRLVCNRTDDRWPVRERHQEMPALYTNTILCKQFTYVGPQPWTGGELTQIIRQGPPWTSWGPGMETDGLIEGWAANVNDTGWGVGVYYKNAEHIIGGLVHDCGHGEEHGATTYLSPIETIALAPDTVLDWEYTLIVGTLEEMRDYVYANPPDSAGSRRWEFGSHNNAWHAVKHLRVDESASGALVASVTGPDPVLVCRDALSFPAKSYPWFHVRLRNNTSSSTAQLFWVTGDAREFSPEQHVDFEVAPNTEEFRDYHVDLSEHPEWRGSIWRLRFDPAVNSATGTLAIEQMAINNKPDSFEKDPPRPFSR